MILALDLSTKTGWSLLDGPSTLVKYGTIKVKVEGDFRSSDYPFNYMDAAEEIAHSVWCLVRFHAPDMVVIEETNKGKNRYSQKLLEFIHFAVANDLRGVTHIRYIDTSEWRKLVGCDYSEKELKAKSTFSHAKRDRLKAAIDEVRPFFDEALAEHLALAKTKGQRNRVARLFERVIRDVAQESVARKAVRSDGVRVKPVGKKHVSVRRVNEMFGTSFELEDNDICDSICVGVGYYLRRSKR